MVRCSFFFSFLGISLLFSQELPPIKHFSPIDYNAENQNWSIDQGLDGSLYFANNKGLITFNGEDWSLYSLPNETIIRSVKVVGDKIFTGSYKAFGYWKKNRFGQLDYISISDKIEEVLLAEEEYWDIHHYKEHTLFRSKKRLYVYDHSNEALTMIDAKTSFPKLFNLNGEIFYQKTNEGLFKIHQGKEVLVSTEKIVQQNEVVNIFDKSGKMLLLTRNKGFFTLEDGKFLPWVKFAKDQNTPYSFYCGIRLKNGGFALGTVSHGLLMLNKTGQIEYQVNRSNGLGNNTVLAIFEDKEENIWMGLDNGISFLNTKSPFLMHNDKDGVLGSVYSSIMWKGKLYLGTNQGLFFRDFKLRNNFKMIPGTEGQVWSLDPIEDQLFCSHHKGTFIISDSSAQKIENTSGTWKVKVVEGRPNFVLQGNYDGLYVLLKNQNGTWKVRNKLANYGYSSRYFEKLDNLIFVNHEYHGVFKINIDERLDKAVSVELDSIQPGFNSGIFKYKGDVFHAYKNGILKYDSIEDVFVKDSIFNRLFDSEYVSGKVEVRENENKLWFFSKENIGFAGMGSLSNKLEIEQIPIGENNYNRIPGYENISKIVKDQYLLGTTSGYITLNLNKVSDFDFDVRIASVKNSSSLENALNSRCLLDEKGDFEATNNNLKISFHTSHFNVNAKPSYRYQLSTQHDNWSHWSKTSYITFENLPYGDYTFKVQAKMGDMLSNNIAAYHFRINRPYYLSLGALAIYFVSSITFLLFIHSRYKKYYTQRQTKLVEQNKKALALQKVQKEKEIIKLKNQQLKEQFRSKSNELAASTLSIIKKNQLLGNIKKELIVAAQDKSQLKSVIKIIENSLNQADDWEMFKEAFNNADRKFLKKLKKRHPNLSPNDIRLCAYLRLNLSSKEIAPMFNISVRSVEIKRYRLRKKMDLSREENLTDYIQKF